MNSELAAVQLNGLKCRRGNFVLGPLDLTVPHGAVVALIGANGAGKTTTLDMIMGLGRPDAGSILVYGHAQPKGDIEIKKKTGFVNPDLDFSAWRTVGRAIDFNRGFYPDWDNGCCARLMAQFGIKSDDQISAQSFGTRMKLSLVMALSRAADLLLLDEPTVGLDVPARRFLFEEIKRKERSVIISSHQVSDLERHADFAAILHRGRLLKFARIDLMIEQYLMVDARVSGVSQLTEKSGLKVIEHAGDRTQFLLDTAITPVGELSGFGVEVISQVRLSLEDLFIALTKE